MEDVLTGFIKKKRGKADEYRGRIEEMLDRGGYFSSQDFLISILDFIEANDCITEKQMKAVDNLEGGVQEYD